MTVEDETMPPADAPEDEPMEEENDAENEDPSIFGLRLLPLTHDLHQKHGLRHNDFQRYRGYCSRRIARVRKAVKLVQGEKKKFHKKLVDADNATKDEKMLLIPLMTAERAWAYAMQLKFEMNTEPRKRFHMINRLRKAAKGAEALEKLVMALDAKCDARAKLETQAYAAWMAGSLAFELQDWKTAAVALTKARTIYEKVSEAISEDDAVLYKQRMAEIVPSLRFCAYNTGDDVAKQELLASLRGSGLDELISQTREEQAATLQEVEWHGRKMAVKQEKVRLFLLREQEFAEEELKPVKDDYEATIEAYESLLLDCKDAVQVLRDDLVEDPAFRNRQQASEGPTTAAHFLYTYLCHIKCARTIDRNLAMTNFMRRCLEGEKLESKKPVKPSDLVRLFETIIQNLNDQPSLAGLEEDIEFRQSIEACVVYFKAWRCNYLAQAFLAAQKWPEAMALFQRATVYANKAKNDKMLEDKFRSQVPSLLSMIEGRQFMAHANSILDTEGVTDRVAKVKLEDKKMLIDRLEEYYEDEDLVKGKPNLVSFPPNFTAIPCKPLFFDLAREQLAFPDLDDRMASQAGPGGQGGPGGQQGASGGWLGGWLGWGGKK